VAYDSFLHVFRFSKGGIMGGGGHKRVASTNFLFICCRYGAGHKRKIEHAGVFKMEAKRKMDD